LYGGQVNTDYQDIKYKKLLFLTAKNAELEWIFLSVERTERKISDA